MSAQLRVANLSDIDPPLLVDAVVSNNTAQRMYDISGPSKRLSHSLQYRPGTVGTFLEVRPGKRTI